MYNSELIWRPNIFEVEKGSSTTTYFQPAPEHQNKEIYLQVTIYKLHRQIQSLTYNANSMEKVVSA